MPKYTVQDTTTGKKVTFDWNDTNPPTDADMEQVFSAARSSAPEPAVTPTPSGPEFNPDMYPMDALAKNVAIRGGMETLGQVGGGLAGSVGGPAGVLAGETAGYVAGSKGADYLLGEGKDRSIADAAKEGAIYSVVGRAIPTVAKAAAKAIPKSVADKLYRSAAKLETVLDPDNVRRLLDSAYENRIQVGTGKRGQDRLVSFLEGLSSTIDDMIKPVAGDFVSTDRAIDRALLLAKEYKDIPVAKPYLEELGGLVKQFSAEKGSLITVEQAQSIKRKAWRELETVFRKEGRINNPTSGTIVGHDFNKAVGSALREEIETKIPGIAGPNQAWGDAIELQRAVDRAVGRISNKDILSIMDPLAMAAAKNTELWGPGMKAAIARRLLEWPRFKSILAIEIANAGKRPLLKATPGAAAIPQIGANLLSQ
jgi:hypothetical protein